VSPNQSSGRLLAWIVEMMPIAEVKLTPAAGATILAAAANHRPPATISPDLFPQLLPLSDVATATTARPRAPGLSLTWPCAVIDRARTDYALWSRGRNWVGVTSVETDIALRLASVFARHRDCEATAARRSSRRRRPPCATILPQYEAMIDASAHLAEDLHAQAHPRSPTRTMPGGRVSGWSPHGGGRTWP
jgi:hypothetical protein